MECGGGPSGPACGAQCPLGRREKWAESLGLGWLADLPWLDGFFRESGCMCSPCGLLLRGHQSDWTRRPGARPRDAVWMAGGGRDDGSDSSPAGRKGFSFPVREEARKPWWTLSCCWMLNCSLVLNLRRPWNKHLPGSSGPGGSIPLTLALCCLGLSCCCCCCSGSFQLHHRVLVPKH